VDEGRKDASLVDFKDRWEEFVEGIGNYAVGTGLWTRKFWKSLRRAMPSTSGSSASSKRM
jgi:hypothetical protein